MKNYDTVDALAGLFECLKGGSLVAISEGPNQGTVRMIVENRVLLSGIADSWGRVVVTLKDCRRFAFRSENPGPGVDLMDLASRTCPALITARKRADVCEVFCLCGTVHGTLEMTSDDFSIMLGSGRVLELDEFLEELDMRGDTSYAMAT